MRSLLAAVSVVVLASLVLARTVLAEPPPQTETRDIKKVLEALGKVKERTRDYAALRFYAEVFGGDSVSAPVGSPMDTVGTWGDEALLLPEGSLGSCEGVGEEGKKAAARLVKEYGDTLAPQLRAYTLGLEGKNKAAADLFALSVEAMAPGKSCPGEHPMYSGRRVGRMTRLLGCIQRLDPKRDVSKLKKLVDQAQQCLENNHAVG